MSPRPSREEYEESLRAPEPRSKLVVVATILWILLTAALVGACLYWMPNARGTPRLVIAIVSGSAMLYGVVAHQNRLGDRSID